MRNAHAILSLRDVRVKFGGIVALNLRVLDIPQKPGLAALFMGPNGAGKTTLLNAITGYVPIADGEILFTNDRTGRLDGLSCSAIVRAGVVRTFQAPPIFASLSVREGLCLAALAGQRLTVGEKMVALFRRASPHHRISSLVDVLIDELALAHVQHALTRDLPLQVIRRVELARCLAAQPRVLLLDEPTAGADHDERDYLAGLLAQGLSSLVTRLASANLYRHNLLTICLVTHDMLFARAVVNTAEPVAFFLDQGNVVASGSLEEVTSNARVRQVYFAEEQHPDA